MRGEDTRAMLRRLGVARWKLPFIARHMRRLMAGDIASIALFPGVDTLLCELDRAGVAIAIVSSNAEANVRRILGPALSARVAHFACGASLFGKAVKMRRLLRRTGLPTAAVLAIGDEIRDIEAAESVGVASGAVTWGYASAAALRARGPTFLFERIEEIGDLVGRANRPP